MSQRRWGSKRCHKFLVRNQIGEMKQVGGLTDRQRRLLATQLESCESLVTQIESRASGDLQLAGVGA